MNPLTNVRNLTKINERELSSGAAGDDRRSWHAKYKNSAWVFVGGLPYELTEGDAISVFSQYGEIVNINLIRDKKTGKFRGFGFICYEDQRSSVLAVDNFNGTKILGRTIRVDHVENYRVPKEHDDMDEQTLRLFMQGCAPEVVTHKPPVERPPEKKEEESWKKEERTEKKHRKDRSRSRERKTEREKKRHHNDSDRHKDEKRHRHK